MKSRIIIIALSIGLLAGINGCGFMSKKYLKTSSEKHQIDITGKQKVTLENVKGSIKVIRSNEPGLLTVKASKEIKVKKKFLDTPFDEIKVTIDSEGQTVEIKTEITNNREDGFFKFNTGRDQRVDYEINVPPGIEIEIENVNGNISASKLSNDLKIDLVNGEVGLDNYTGRLKCEITNGSFSADIDSTTGMEVSTINGGVTLNLNNFINANLRAETVNGRITDENLQLRVVEKEKKLFKGKLGSGETDVDINIETVNGKIKLIGRSEI